MALSDVSDVKQMGTLEKALSYPLSANLDLYPFGEVTDPAWIPLLVKVLDHKSRTVRVRAAAALARFTGYFERQLGGCHSTEDEEKVIQFWKDWWSSGKGREFMEKSKKRGADDRVIQIPPPPSDSTGGAPDRPAPGPSPDGTSGGSAPPSRPPGTTED
jgi:hypothetical protein